MTQELLFIQKIPGLIHIASSLKDQVVGLIYYSILFIALVTHHNPQTTRVCKTITIIILGNNNKTKPY